MMRDRIDARFCGARAGTAPLTWGQRGMWEALASNRQAWNLGSVLELSHGRADVALAVDAIGQLLSRHESLRTLYRVVDGVPHQVVVRSGSLPVSVVTCGPAEARDKAGLLNREQCRLPFNPDSELPVRISLIVIDGFVRYVVLAYFHVSVDHSAVQLIRDDLNRVLATGSFPSEPGLQPLDLARREQSDGTAVSARAIRYWAEHLRRIPPAMLSPVGPACEPRHQEAHLTSVALRAAAKRLAASHRTTATTVVLAAGAMVLGAWTRHPVVAMNVHFGNRFKPEYQRVTGNLVQLGLFVLDLPPHATFHDIVPLAKRSALHAYRYAYYDQAALGLTRQRVNAERGAEINPFCCFNAFDSGFDKPDRLDTFSAQDILACRAESKLTWSQDAFKSRCRFCLRIGGSADEAQPVLLTADTEYLPPDQIEWFLREIEQVLVSSACADPAAG